MNNFKIYQKIRECFFNLGFLLGMIFLLSDSTAQAQQFFSYTQYMNNLTPINHAYSLLDKVGSVSGLYRKQWSGIDGAPSTFIFNTALPLEKIKAVAGLVILDDKFGVEHQSEINAYFAKSIQLTTENYLAVSLNAGIRMYSANYSILDPSDPSFKNDVRESKPNLGFGVMYYSNNYYAGVSVPEINLRSMGNASLQDDTDFRNHYYFSGAYLFGKEKDDIRIKPSTLLSYTNGIPFIADFSTTVYLKELLGLGLNYRTNKEMAGIVTINFDSLKFGYSYQFGTASDNIARGLNHSTNEVTLTCFFGKRLGGRKLL